MDKNKMMEYAKDIKSDLRYSLEADEEYVPKTKDIEVINWLIEQAKRAEMYKFTLMHIGTKHEPPSSGFANAALIEADLRFNK